MNCCRLAATEAQFGERVARRDLENYRRHGLTKTTQIMLQALRTFGVADATLLDVGGGIGALHHELLDQGVREATEVEPSSAYLEAAESEARRRGHERRVRFVHGLLADVRDELPTFDIVTLDRVICCDPDPAALAAAASAKSRRLVAVSFPRERWFVRLLFLLENFGRRLVRNEFRSYVHPTERVEAAFSEAGFARASYRETVLWQVIVYRAAAG